MVAAFMGVEAAADFEGVEAAARFVADSVAVAVAVPFAAVSLVPAVSMVDFQVLACGLDALLAFPAVGSAGVQ